MRECWRKPEKEDEHEGECEREDPENRPAHRKVDHIVFWTLQNYASNWNICLSYVAVIRCISRRFIQNVNWPIALPSNRFEPEMGLPPAFIGRDVSMKERRQPKLDIASCWYLRRFFRAQRIVDGIRCKQGQERIEAAYRVAVREETMDLSLAVIARIERRVLNAVQKWIWTCGKDSVKPWVIEVVDHEQIRAYRDESALWEVLPQISTQKDSVQWVTRSNYDNPDVLFTERSHDALQNGLL